jgi:CubicO group peptidase (beta-lactamase class C family)
MTRFSTLILILLSVLSLHSQPVVRLTPSAPEVAGVSSDRLKRIDAYMQKHVDDGQLNGGTMIIVRKGRIVYHRAFGKSDLEKGTNMKRDDLFRIASMTKPVVSTAVMMLLEEGKFALDDPISKYIPDFAKPTVIQSFNEKDTSWTSVPAKSEITVRHLLSQTSGIGYAQIGSAQARAIYYKHGINGGIGTPGSTLKEVIPRLAKLPLFHHPGEKYLYGLNVDVLGYLVEIWSGMPLDRFMQERLFGPLGMKDTHFFLPKEKYPRLVTLYKQDEDMKLGKQDSIIRLNGDFYRDFPKTPNGSFFSGGAGLTSTALDYAIFCQMYLNGGTYNGVRILSPHTIRMMTSNQVGTLSMGKPNDPNRFGLGFGVYTKGSEAVTPAQEGSFDWGGMFATHFWIDPKSELACVFLRNIWPLRNGELQARLKNLVYQALTD